MANISIFGAPTIDYIQWLWPGFGKNLVPAKMLSNYENSFSSAFICGVHIFSQIQSHSAYKCGLVPVM